MKPLRLIAILALTVAFLTASGCSLTPDRPVYMAPGQTAELAETGKYRVWVTNKKTGGKELRVLDTRTLSGIMIIGRPKNAED